jgi:hypothetical protein
MMVSLSSLSKEQWESIVRSAEFFAIVLTFFGAGSGVIYILANRPLRRLEAAEKADTARATEELRLRYVETELRLEQERIKRLELEAAVAPRTIRLSKGVVDRLKRNAGTVLRIEYRPGEERQRLAEQLRALVHWADWKVVVAPSEELEFKFPMSRELREGVDIGGGSDGFPRDDAFTGVPKYKAAEELWRFLRANDIDATLHIDAGFWEPGKPIVVKIWPKPLPYSVKSKLGTSWELFPQHASIQREVKEREDAEEKKRLEANEHLRKEWYPDGEQ